MATDDIWRNLVNGINIDLPEVMEAFVHVDEEEDDEEEPTVSKSLGEQDAAILRFRFDVYLIHPQEEGSKAYMVNANQLLEDMGIMKIKEALKLIKKRKK